jgi:hypothetical protein
MRLGAAYIYTDPAHRPLLMKIRREGWTNRGDKFTQRAARYTDGRLYWKGGRDCFEKYQPEWADKAMYNLPILLDALRTGADVYFCEGERDCDTITSLWRFAATTNWQGASDFTPSQAEWFTWYRSQSRINLLIDNDDAGHAAAWLRRRRLKAAGVQPRRIRLYRPADPAHKDTTDVALVGLGLGAYVRVRPSEVRERAAQYRAQVRSGGERGSSDWRARAVV